MLVSFKETKNPEASVEIKEALVTTNPSVKLNEHSDNSTGNYCGIEQEPLLTQHHPSYTHNSADMHLMLQAHQLPSVQTDEIDGAQATDYFYVKKPLPPQTIPTNYENINLCNSLYVTHPSNSKSESTLSLNQYDQRYANKELPSGLRTSVTNSLISENFNASDADPLNVNYQSYHLPRSPQCFITSNNRTEHPIDHHPHQNGYVMYPMQLQHQPEHHYPVQRVMEPIYYAKNNQQHPPAPVDGMYTKEPTWPSRIPASNNGLSKLAPHIETISNRTPPTLMKPPPYTYAKAFTRMTPNDLMLYESFRNKTLNNGDVPDGNDHENPNVYNGCNDNNENGMQQQPTNGMDTNLNQEIDTDDIVVEVENNSNEVVDEDQNHTNLKNFSARNEIGTANVTKNVRSGKPWMFGVHKNPKVVSVME